MGSGAAPNVRGTSSAAYVASTASSSAPSPGPIDGWSFTCVGRREERREPRVRLGARTKDAGGLERAGGARGGRGATRAKTRAKTCAAAAGGGHDGCAQHVPWRATLCSDRARGRRASLRARKRAKPRGVLRTRFAAERGFFSLGRRGAGRLVLGVVEPRGRPQARVWMFGRAVGSRTAGKQLAIARAPRARASPGARRANRKLTVPKPGLTMRRLARSRPRLRKSALVRADHDFGHLRRQVG